MRLVLFYLVLLMMQGFLGALLSPLPAPDLFLLAVLTLLWRLQPWQLVLLGYGVGMLQDVMGHGVLGTHAFGLAGAALFASFIRAQLTQSGFFEQLLIVLAAIAGKWVVMVAMLSWLSRAPGAALAALPMVPVEAVFTLLVSIFLLPFAEILLQRVSLLRKELL